MMVQHGNNSTIKMDPKNKKNSLTYVVSQLNSIEKKVDGIRKCLLGDEYDPCGLVENDKKQDRRLTRLEKFMYICIGGLTVINFLIIILK